MIKNLQLTPHIHKKQAIISLYFFYGIKLVDFLKKQKSARWSQNLKAWRCFVEKDKQYSFSNISKILLRAAKAAGILKRVPHMLRHSFATHLLEQGISFRHIQILLGYNISKTAELYIQVSVQEIGKIKNTLDDFYKTKSSTIHADLGSIFEQKQKLLCSVDY